MESEHTSRMPASEPAPLAEPAADTGEAIVDASASADESAAAVAEAEPGQEGAAVPDASATAGESAAAARPTPTTARSWTPAPRSVPQPAEPAEPDLGAAMLLTLVKRYGPPALAGVLAVLVVWLVRRRTH
jgi:hypothetical protein